ncbi:MAG: hypothetical protein U5L96_21695 [Owenweeksia sp.]|nr:hypothetical protein [Owenweeksia sp.]
MQERYYNQNLAGVVMLTDGIYNRGSDPAYAARSLPFPIYSVGFGDTTVPRDLFIDLLGAQ